jgi:hypothetical protein
MVVAVVGGALVALAAVLYVIVKLAGAGHTVGRLTDLSDVDAPQPAAGTCDGECGGHGDARRAV